MSPPEREQTIVSIEHPNLRSVLEQAEPPARLVFLDDIDQVKRYAGAKVVDLIIVSGEVQKEISDSLQTVQRTQNPHGQVLRIDAGGLASGLTELDPWRGPDAPPPPQDDDLAEIIGMLLEYTRIGSLTGMLGVSEAVVSVLRTVVRVAPVDVPVLIWGESGTGKELIARGIHQASRRYGNPFIAVNTPGLSETLIESELFGHEKGAFTGAVSRKPGVFEAAGDGTIFLDEIGDLSRNLQSKLLRVLEQHEFLRVGGTEPIRVRARVLAATNVDLEQAVREGKFREDLYYRLQVVRVDLPPLRERPEDVLPLLQHFITQVCKSHNTTFVGFTDDAVAFLQRYPWPGNVRELRNLIEQVVLLHPGEKITAGRITRIFEERSHDKRNLPVTTGKTPDQVEREMIFKSLQALREEIANLRESLSRPEGSGLIEEGGGWITGERREVIPGGGINGEDELLGDVISIPLGTPLDQIELCLIKETLQRLGGDKRRTAEVLGIGLRTLYRRLDKLVEMKKNRGGEGETSREQNRFNSS